ncbi:hypothetical protein H4Q26_016808 [Puccinia striiformis f. sp. tritici PST-130]|nr:hypothetical protein H4Q26_016808 [Puccinia striiformis f. sp. tritici PST-130]
MNCPHQPAQRVAFGRFCREFSQFSSLINMMRSSFGNQFGGMISPFANLGTGLSQFLSQAQQSQSSSFQLSSNTMQQLVLPTLQSVIPGFQVPSLGI